MSESAQKVISELTSAGLLSSDRITDYAVEIESGIDVLIRKLIGDGCITAYQGEKLKAGEASEIYFGDYIVIEKLGQGGMGTVLLAKHRRMERNVAIKVLPITALESADAVARFYQEVKVAAQLTHPNIVHAYDAGEHHGFHYLVMEYVPGHDLAEVLSQLGPIPLPMVLDYVKQASRGLDYAHRIGIVHRDIKPSNLLLNNEGDIKILDMGLARLGDSSVNQANAQLTTTGQVMGTVEYMSPEQAEDTRQADQRSDIYSLGCTMFRLLTGRSPYSRETVVKTILAHRGDPIPPIESTLPEGPAVDGLFQKMVAKSPTDRFQSMAELIEAIEKIESGDVWQTDSWSIDPSDHEHVPAANVHVVSDAASPASSVPAPRQSPTTPTELPTDGITMSAVRIHPKPTTNRSTSAVQTPANQQTDSSGVIYIPDLRGNDSHRPGAPPFKPQIQPSKLWQWMPWVAFGLLLIDARLYVLSFAISFFGWRRANRLLNSTKTTSNPNINQSRARRLKWFSIAINCVSAICIVIRLISVATN